MRFDHLCMFRQFQNLLSVSYVDNSLWVVIEHQRNIGLCQQACETSDQKHLHKAYIVTTNFGGNYKSDCADKFILWINDDVHLFWRN